MGEAIHSGRTMITTRGGVKRKASPKEMEEAEARLRDRDVDTAPRRRDRGGASATPPRHNRERDIARRSGERDVTTPLRHSNDRDPSADRDVATPSRCRKNKDVATPPRHSREREVATLPRRTRDRDISTPPRHSRDRDVTTPPRRSRDRDRDAATRPRRNRGRDISTPPPRHSRDRDVATPPRHSRDRDAGSRHSRDKDSTPPRRHSKGRDTTPPSKDTNGTPPRRRDREATPPVRKRVREAEHKVATLPRHKDKDATPPRRRDKDATPPRHRDREATLPLQKRVRETERKSESENTEETRKLKDLWKEAFTVGAGLYKMDSRQEEFKWDFSNLEQAFEENGELYHEIVGNNNKVYLFGLAERHVWIQDKVTVPVVVAVASPSPPSDEVNAKPVELDGEGGGQESRIPMKQLKIDWIQCTTPELERIGRCPCVFVLGSTRRSTTALENSKNEDHTAKFQSFIPCLDHHNKEEEHYECRVQCEMHELAKNIISETIEGDEELSPILKAGLKEYVAHKLFLAKRKHRQSYRERISNTQKEATSAAKDSGNMGKIYKFYPVPTPEAPDISKTKYPFHGYYCEQEAESKISLCDFAASIC